MNYSFIRDFYYGNIDPQQRSFRNNAAMKKKMNTLTDNEDRLRESLSGKLKQAFLDYVDAWAEINSESNLDSFIVGFRMGARFAYDAFVSGDAPFEG